MTIVLPFNGKPALLQERVPGGARTCRPAMASIASSAAQTHHEYGAAFSSISWSQAVPGSAF